MNSGHLVLLPYMAHGHLLPFLSLARKLKERTPFTVTIATTPLNLQYLRTLDAGDSPEIQLAELPFRSADHGLPPDTENTEKVPPGEIRKFLQAINRLKDPVERLVEHITDTEGRLPVGLVFDVLLGWVVDVGKKFGIKNIAFTTGGAYGTLAYNSLWLHLPHRSTDSDEFEVPGFPNHIRFHRTQLPRFIREIESSDPWCTFFQPQISASLSADAWLCNTVKQLEPLGLKLLRNYLQIPLCPVGPLLSLHKYPSSSDMHAITEWLSQHAPDSVLYISFGSQNTISASQMMALAMGLEASRNPFVWVIKPPLGFGEFRPEWLPQGFAQRMTGTNKGLLIRTWAPQLEILSHGSIGAFLNHGGWNSVMESLSQGVPMIGWPIAAEQSYNVKMLVEELGVCVELTRWVDGEIDCGEVKRVVEMVMDRGGKGEELRRKAVELGEKIRASIRDDMEELESFVLAN